MSKHTAGEWYATFEDSYRVRSTASGMTVCILTHLSKSGRVADEEVKANAHLIAALPDMLDALEDTLRRDSPDLGRDGADLPIVLREKIEAAIAKAKPNER